MQNVYNNIDYATGEHIAGLFKVFIIPIEWIDGENSTNFIDGKITLAAPIAGKNFIELNFLPDTYDYNETPKTSKSGSFYLIELSGITNDITAENLAILNTLRHHKFMVKFMDRNKVYKAIGDFQDGMTLEYATKENSNAGGTKQIIVNMAIESLNPAAFLPA